MYTTDTDKKIAEAIKERMCKLGKTLSTAESCTSGRIAATLTSVDGASEYVQGGLVAYQDDVKSRFLGVPPSLIKEYDVVSEPVVKAMVAGACKMFDTDFAIASTGYAGSGSNGISSGTIWIGWGGGKDIHAKCLNENLGREANTAHAAECAVREFLDYINSRM
ncbi:MAG: CinA family protein [Bacteroidaceae bacterium]|nr:CinA family protein [Bacteroidaceae bacterium]